MKKTIAKSIAMCIIACMAFSGCKKAETGPKGDKGDTGPAGTNGINGTNGVNGTNGNANVIGSNEVTVSSWSQNGNAWTATLNYPAITQNIVDKGIVSVFIKYGSSWWALPDLTGINSTSYGFDVNTVTLLNANSNNSLPSNPGTKTFRVVVISPSNRAANPNTNWNNYNEIKKALNLKD